MCVERGGGALWLSRPIDMTRGPQCGLDAARGRFIKWLINCFGKF